MDKLLLQIPGGADTASEWADAGSSALLFGAVCALGFVVWWVFKKLIESYKDKQKASKEEIDSLKASHATQIADYKAVVKEKDDLYQEVQTEYKAMMREQIKAYTVVMNGYENVINVLGTVPKEMLIELQPVINDMRDKLMAQLEGLPEKNKEKIVPSVKESLRDLMDKK